MPLIVPGITNTGKGASTSSSGGGGTDPNSWMTKLMGKKLSDSHSTDSFAKKDLPSKHRIVEGEGGMMTMDHQPDRLNVHVDNDGIVKKVTAG